MIPADHFHDNGDGTAWWVTADPIASSEGWAMTIDRPCDTCDGEGVTEPDRHDHPDHGLCPDCSGCGRHTFRIDVRDEAWAPPTQTFRCSVVPGMVLPIHPDAHFGKPAIIMSSPPMIVQRPPRLFDGDSLTEITLPSATAPGMYAVKVQVHQQ